MVPSLPCNTKDRHLKKSTTSEWSIKYLKRDWKSLGLKNGRIGGLESVVSRGTGTWTSRYTSSKEKSVLCRRGWLRGMMIITTWGSWKGISLGIPNGLKPISFLMVRTRRSIDLEPMVMTIRERCVPFSIFLSISFICDVNWDAFSRN